MSALGCGFGHVIYRALDWASPMLLLEKSFRRPAFKKVLELYPKTGFSDIAFFS